MPPAEPKVLADLLEISQTLASALDIRSALGRVLEHIEQSLGAVSATVALREADGDELMVESGRAIVVPEVSREPLFLNRTGILGGHGKGELTYVCVPVTVSGRTVGTLGVALPYRKDRRYDQETARLSIVGAMLGQAVRVHRLVEAERSRLVEENTKLRHELKERYQIRSLIGNSRPMQQLYDQVAQVAPSSTTVLVRGESGTGKELVAHAIHYGSPRADRPLIKVSCGALPEALVESELFGYEPGAFTDARAQKKGRFELADGGTLFLDEVGELTPSTQVKLLRALQEKEFERLGGVKPIKVNVRLIAATNKDLEAAVQQGAFREDLYYRLNVFSVYLPPLRERKPDIPLLADHFVEKYAARETKDVRRIATTAIDMLMSYHWPGNVRELENCIERAVLVCEGGVIHGHHLPPTLQTAEVSGTMPRLGLAAAVAAYEKDMILDALKTARGNRARAARLLDSTERIVGYKVNKYAIDEDRFKA
jgi:Nif-specific regulatory protein